MDWQIRTIGRGSQGTSILHDAALADSDWAAIESKLADAWGDVVGMIADHLRANPDEAWSALVASIRPDTGQVTLVPSTAHGWNRGRVIHYYTVELRQLEQEWSDLPDADDDPHGFDREHDAMMARAADAVSRSLTEPLRRLRSVRPFELWRCDYSDADELRPWR